MIYGIAYINNTLMTANTPQAAEDLWSKQGSLYANIYCRQDGGPTSIFYTKKWIEIHYYKQLAMHNDKPINLPHRIEGPFRIVVNFLDPDDPYNLHDGTLTTVNYAIQGLRFDSADDFFRSEPHQAWLKDTLTPEEHLISKLSGPNEEEMIRDIIKEAMHELKTFSWTYSVPRFVTLETAAVHI